MSTYDDGTEHVMRTRKRRRDYKSLEDGKDDPSKFQGSKTRAGGAKDRKAQKNNFISIDTNHLKPSEKVVAKPPSSQTSQNAEGGRTSGRWTSEEHK